jgi:crossover junction endodeoxyribonuclease RusA
MFGYARPRPQLADAVNLPSLTFTLPLPPSFNKQYFTHQGRHVLTPWSRRYRDAVAYRLHEMHWDDRLSDAFLAAAGRGYLSLFMRYYFETPLRRDLDSGLKIVQDAVVTRGLGIDDTRVVDLRLLKQIDPLRPRVEVSVDVIDGWDWAAADGEPVGPITLTLPIPPSINDQYVIVKGRRHRSGALRRFRKHVQAYAEAHRIAEQLPAALRARANPGYLAVYADFFFGARHTRDLDSGLKALLDALCAPLGINDNRVVDIHLTKRTTAGEPYTLVQLEPLAGWTFDAQHPVLRPSPAGGDAA